MLNVEVRKLYEEWTAENDEETAELIYCAYLHALRGSRQSVEEKIDRDGPPSDETDHDPDEVPQEEADDGFDELPIGFSTSRSAAER